MTTAAAHHQPPQQQQQVILLEEEEYKLEVIFDGYKIFWMTHANLEVTLIHHEDCHTMEIIAFDPITREEPPRLYVKFRLLLRLFNREVIQGKVEEVRKRKRNYELEESVLTHMAVIELGRDYILERLQMLKASDNGYNRNIGEEGAWTIVLVPKVTDEVNESTGLLQVQCSQPQMLVPAKVKRLINAGEESWEETLQHFQALVTSDRLSKDVLPPIDDHHLKEGDQKPSVSRPPSLRVSGRCEVGERDILKSPLASQRRNSLPPLQAPLVADCESSPTSSRGPMTEQTSEAPENVNPLRRALGFAKRILLDGATASPATAASETKAKTNQPPAPFYRSQSDVMQGDRRFTMTRNAVSESHLAGLDKTVAEKSISRRSVDRENSIRSTASAEDDDTVTRKLKARQAKLKELNHPEGNGGQAYTFYQPGVPNSDDLVSPIKRLSILGKQTSAMNILQDIPEESGASLPPLERKPSLLKNPSQRGLLAKQSSNGKLGAGGMSLRKQNSGIGVHNQ
eukprot:gene7320-8101_t